MTKRIPLGSVRIDGGTQMRACISHETVRHYLGLMQAGVAFPPIAVFLDEDDDAPRPSYWLVDGFHRYMAARKFHQPADSIFVDDGRIDAEEIEAEVHCGTQRDAILYACGANAENPLQRTDTDRRRAVMTLVLDKEWGQWSNCEIARRAAVSEHLVREVRASLRPGRSDPPARAYVTKHGAISAMNVSKIGARATPLSAAGWIDLQSALDLVQRVEKTSPPSLVRRIAAVARTITQILAAHAPPPEETP